ncbi:MAG: outer membrane lipoprotein carrier protein LolA [Desulfohalobiaceae bacterium]
MRVLGQMLNNMQLMHVAVVLLVCIWGLTSGMQQAAAEVRQEAQAVESVQAEFTQKRYLQMLEEPLTSKGVMYFKAPDSLRWEYTDPVQSVLLMQEESIQQYVEADQGMQQQEGQDLESMRVFLQEICLWIQGEFEANPGLEVKRQSEDVVLLEPVQENALAEMIQGIEVRLGDSAGIIDSVKVLEGPETYMEIKFQDTRINQDIKDQVFQDP